MAGTHRRWIGFLVPVLLAAGLGGAAGRAPARAGAAARPADRTGTATLPESVLARVGTGRDITLSRFVNAWTQLQPPDRPDSLTPEAAREFLQLLIGKEALGEAALRERWVWTPDESTEYLALRDRLVLGAALDSALAAMRGRLVAAGASVPDDGMLGLMVRDSLIASLGLRFDVPLLEGLARAFKAIPRPSRDSSLVAQLRMMGAMPQVEDSLLPRVVAEGRSIRFTVADLLDAWKHTNPFLRPRVESADQVRDLAANGIYERVLRREAERRRLAERPDIARALAERREFIAVNHLVAREVYAKIATDSLTLDRHYRAHPDRWSLPLRLNLIRMVLADRKAAARMRLQLANAAEAESLVARGARAGVQYRMAVSAETDSVLFARALASGPGTVFGPDSAAGGWAVTRVTEIVPARRRTFTEARQLVHRDWYGEEGERLMKELLDRLRRQTPVAINDRALGAVGGASP